MSLSVVIVGVCVVINVTCAVRLYLMMRRWDRLNDAWFALCLGAYQLRHWPHLVRELRQADLAMEDEALAEAERRAHRCAVDFHSKN